MKVDNLRSLLKIKDTIGVDTLYAKDWTITDFDNFLKGNPHVTDD
jgi:hypothetical protein